MLLENNCNKSRRMWSTISQLEAGGAANFSNIDASRSPCKNAPRRPRISANPPECPFDSQMLMTNIACRHPTLLQAFKPYREFWSRWTLRLRLACRLARHLDSGTIVWIIELIVGIFSLTVVFAKCSCTVIISTSVPNFMPTRPLQESLTCSRVLCVS